VTTATGLSDGAEDNRALLAAFDRRPGRPDEIHVVLVELDPGLVDGGSSKARDANLDGVTLQAARRRLHERPLFDRRVALEDELERSALAAVERVARQDNEHRERAWRDLDRPRKSLGTARPPGIATGEAPRW
jgi:hypothetical protein